MSRGQLPKPYLRIDPDIDQKHPDNLDGFVRLMCAANRQLPRGTFRSRAVLDSLFGKTAVDRFVKRRDVVEAADGKVHVQHWDDWQEGDWTVGDRMRRIRAKGVTEPSPESDASGDETSPNSIPPSEASRHKTFTPSIEGEAAGKPRQPSERQKVVAWLTDHGLTRPTGYVLSDLTSVVKGTSAEAVIGAFEEALSLRAAVTTKNYVNWAEKTLTPNQPRNGATSPAGHHGNQQEIADAFRA